MSRNKLIPEPTTKQLRNFWLKVDKRGPDDCWPWLASKNQYGYGRLGLRPRIFYAHRIMYYLATGKQPGPLCVCHTCDVPGCCNPAHLFLGTVAENAADKATKGRGGGGHCAPMPKGVNHWRAKLTEKQVLKIRAAGESQHVLGVKYGVSQTVISSIKLRKSWKHI